MLTRTLYITAALGSTLWMTPVLANDSARDFVTEASSANLFEIESSELALKRTKDMDVRALAQKIVTDHTVAGEKMKVALQTAETQEKPATVLDEKHGDILKDLESTSDEDFDEKYLDVMADAHDEAIELFEDYAESGEDVALKQFATDTLPTLKQHQNHVDQIEDAR